MFVNAWKGTVPCLIDEIVVGNVDPADIYLDIDSQYFGGPWLDTNDSPGLIIAKVQGWVVNALHHEAFGDDKIQLFQGAFASSWKDVGVGRTQGLRIRGTMKGLLKVY